MCGIFGIYQYRGEPSPDIETKLTRAASLLHHRGPDDCGAYISPNRKVGLAHTRLSIIDVASGRQPLCNEDETIWITFNGEIFNYRDLKDQLLKKGHVFKTSSDTEVIVHLYEDLGYKCIDRLRGMFAFAIWDSIKGVLFCARDRLGEKPLVYGIVDGCFYFSSEIFPLTQLTPLSKEISLIALAEYFNTFLPVAPHSIFTHIKKLQPGWAIIVDFEGAHEYRYWQPEYLPKFKEDEEELADRLEDILEESVRIRLMSEVPLGSMLSGGLDSSIVSFFAQKNSTSRLKTFGAFYKEAGGRDLDWQYVQHAADAIGSEHHHIFYDESDLLDRVPSMVAAFGEPYASINGPVSALLSEKIKEHVTVALSGNGGDEVFAGYNTYRKVKWLNNPIVKGMLAVVPENLMDELSRKWAYESLDRSLWKWLWLYPLTLPRKHRAGYVAAPYSRWINTSLFSPKVQAEVGDVEEVFRSLFKGASADNTFDAWICTDMLGRMQENMVCRSDTTGMMSALEIRAPLLDHVLVEFAARLPVNMRIRGWKSLKYLLSKVALRHLPASLVKRKKQGFSGVTYDRLVQQARGLWKSRLEDHLFGSGVLMRTGLFNGKAIQSLWKGLCEADPGSQAATRYFLIVWALVVFEIWHRTVVELDG